MSPMAVSLNHCIILTFSKMSHIKTIKVTHQLQLQHPECWIITGCPGPDFRPEIDVPMDVVVRDPAGNELTGRLTDWVTTRLLDIDPHICLMATGFGNAMYIGMQPVRNMSRMITVWKIKKNQTHD